MELNKIIKYIGYSKNHVRNISYSDAFMLYDAILSGEVPDLELGGILIALRIKGEGEEEICGFYHAMQKQMMQLHAPSNRPMPIVIPSYNGARSQGNLTPLLGLLLVRLGFPVLVHGVSSDPTRVTTKVVLEELGIEPVAGVKQAQTQLNEGHLTYVTIDRLCEPIAKQLLLRWRMGVRNSAHILAKLATPFVGYAALRIASVSHPEYMYRLCKFFQSIDSPAILLNGTEGEGYANPQRCPAINFIRGAGADVEVWVKRQKTEKVVELPKSKSAQDTAEWINEVLSCKRAVPQALRLQLACCLVATGEAESLDSAEARLQKAGV